MPQSLPAYPHPLTATYNGTGSVDVASSYHAALPAQPFNAHIDWLGSFSPSDTTHQPAGHQPARRDIPPRRVDW